MANFILIHGAFQGGWVWEKLIKPMQKAGHEIYAPSLKGAAERINELSADVGLEDHINEICNLIELHKLDDIILVGHSYGGMVISGVATQKADKISQLVFLDAVIPEHNQSLVDVLGAGNSKVFFDLANAQGEGWKVNTFTAEAFGLSKIEDINCAMPRHTPQSLKTFTDKVEVLQAELAHIKKVFIHCMLSNPFMFIMAEKAKEKGMECIQINAPHCPMITHPELIYPIFDNLSSRQ